MTETADQRTGEAEGVTWPLSRNYYRLLADERRRIALKVCKGRDLPVDIGELGAAIAECEVESESVDEDTVAKVVATLHHHHLPKMDDVGVIDYEPDTNRVRSCRVATDGCDERRRQ